MQQGPITIGYNTDLGQPSGQFTLPQRRQIDSLSAFVNRVEAKQSYPKEDMRKLWVKKSAETETAEGRQ